MLGYEPGEFPSTFEAWKDLIHPEDLVRVVTDLTSQIQDTRDFPRIEYRIRAKNGDWLWVLCRGKPAAYDEKGIVTRLIGTNTDITQQKHVEESLRESEERYRKLVENIPDYILVHRNGEILFVNAAAATSFGYSSDELIGSHLMNYLTPESQEVVAEMMKKRFVGEKIPPYEITILPKEGSHKIAEVHGTLIQFEGGPASLNVLTDVTERKQREDAQTFLLRSDYLQSGEDFFKSLARYLAETLSMDYVCIDRLEGDRLSASTVAVYFDGKFEDNVTYTLKDTPCGDVVGKKLCIFSHDVRHLFPEDIVLQDMKAESYVGTTLWGFDGKPIGLIAVIGRKPLGDEYLAESLLKQVGVRAAGELERNLAEQALMESNELFSLFIRHSPIYAFIKVVTPTESRVLKASDNFQQMVGIPGKDMAGKTMDEIFPPEFAEKITADDWAVVSNGEVLTTEENLDDRIYITIKFPIIQRERTLLAGYTIDITDRKQAEVALFEAIQKLRLLTSLTRHDIFNQVSAAELLYEMILQTSDLTKIREYVSEAQQTSEHIVATIGFTREYENFGTVSSGWQLVYQLIEHARKEVSFEEVTLENRISEDLEVYADPIIRKVFTTLIENTIRHGGDVTFMKFSSFNLDNILIIMFEDNGVGIPEREKERIFDHGFGKHTGIGLFLVREILSITGLSIRECGKPGKGVRFEISVPPGKYRNTRKEGL